MNRREEDIFCEEDLFSGDLLSTGKGFNENSRRMSEERRAKIIEEAEERSEKVQTLLEL